MFTVPALPQWDMDGVKVILPLRRKGQSDGQVRPFAEVPG